MPAAQLVHARVNRIPAAQQADARCVVTGKSELLQSESSESLQSESLPRSSISNELLSDVSLDETDRLLSDNELLSDVSFDEMNRWRLSVLGSFGRRIMG